MDHRQIEDQFSVGVYQKRDLVIVRGEGARVWDDAGREYVDCVAGIGVANVGHCHPAVVAAIQAQAARLITCNELFYNDARARCLERLDRITPEGINRFFLCNSGTEAVEGAIKFARMATGRKHVVAAMRGYHGKTLGSLSATWERKYQGALRAAGARLLPRPVQQRCGIREGHRRPDRCRDPGAGPGRGRRAPRHGGVPAGGPQGL